MQRAMLLKVNAPEALALDLLEWLEAAPRAYADVMEAWRTSCPRLPVWEDALDLGWCSAGRAPAVRPSWS